MADLVFLWGLGLDELGFGDCGSPTSRKTAFLGIMKCFILRKEEKRRGEQSVFGQGNYEEGKEREREREPLMVKNLNF